MTLDDVFSNDGLLSKQYQGYEIRPSQVDMARLVEKTVHSKGKVAIVEGETGVGKSFGYLIPTLIHGKQAIVSTSNKNLQAQLNEKDLPTLARILDGVKVTWAVLKGKSNYFCQRSYDLNEEDINNLLQPSQRLALREWVDASQTGDLDECDLDFVDSKVRALICCDSTVPHEKDSVYKAICCASLARDKAFGKQIVLVNHSLLAMELSIRLMSNGQAGVLPQVDNYIVDEAHALETYAQKAFAIEINEYVLKNLVYKKLVKQVTDETQLIELFTEFNKAIKKYQPNMGPTGYFEQHKLGNLEGFEGVCAQIRRIANDLNKIKSSNVEAVEALQQQANSIIDRLERMSKDDSNALRWSEARKLRNGGVVTTIKSLPLEIAPMLKKTLFDGNKNVILTSATLSVGGSFTFLKQNIGAPQEASELVAHSPFDFKRNSLVYINRDYSELEAVEKLLALSKGRAFVLFTSFKTMEYFYDNVRTQYPKLIQARGTSSAQLLQQFKDTPNAVLFGVRSFWEGVDIPGDTLSLVIVQKFPFTNVGDLVHQSKVEKIDKAQGRKGMGFVFYSLPEACIAFKQGIGRLIRTTSDRGVIAILDERIISKGYKTSFLKCLPKDAFHTFALEDVDTFYNNEASWLQRIGE